MPTVIFDLGNVLVNYQPQRFLAQRYAGEAERSFFRKAIFSSSLWHDLDRGRITQEEAVEALSSRYPQQSQDIGEIFAHWFSMLTPIEKNIAWVRRLKERGYLLYVLSNFHLAAYRWAQERYSWLQLFDGKVISALVGEMKPDPAIYRILLSTYALDPRECFFIDDSPANLDTAEGLGITPIRCENPEQLNRELIKLFG